MQNNLNSMRKVTLCICKFCYLLVVAFLKKKSLVAAKLNFILILQEKELSLKRCISKREILNRLCFSSCFFGGGRRETSVVFTIILFRHLKLN